LQDNEYINTGLLSMRMAFERSIFQRLFLA
jgi:hypothetical protein